MGGTKGKPIVDNARSVLMRRGVDPDKFKSNIDNFSSSGFKSTDHVTAVDAGDSAFDKEILEKMSKWKVVHSQNAKDQVVF